MVTIAGINIGISSSIISTTLSVVIIGFIFWIIQKSIQGRREAREVTRGGSTYGNILTKTNALKKKQRKERATQQAAEEEIKPQKGEPEKPLKAAQQTVQAEDKAELQTTEIIETTDVILADLEGTAKEITNEISEMNTAEQVEERELATLKVLERKIRGANKFSQIDQRTAAYLKEVLETFVEHLAKLLSYEGQRVHHHDKFVQHVKQSAQDLAPIVRHARQQTKQLDRLLSKEQKSFRRELRVIGMSMRKKKAQLLVERAKGRDADPVLLQQLTREATMLTRNAKELGVISNQLSQTHLNLKQEVREIMRILQRVIRIAREQRRMVGKVTSREKAVGKRIERLEKNHHEIEKSVDELKNPTALHGAVLQVSAHLNEFFSYYVEEVNMDLEFLAQLQKVVEDNLLISRTLHTLPQLLTAITQSQEGIDNATEAVLSIISIMYSEDVAGSLRAEVANLQAASDTLHDERQIEQMLLTLDEHTQQASMFATRQIKGLIEKETQFKAELEALHEQEAQHLGSAMGTMTNRKVALDTRYMRQAAQFGKKLEAQNANAGAAFRQAHKSNSYQDAA